MDRTTNHPLLLFRVTVLQQVMCVPGKKLSSLGKKSDVLMCAFPSDSIMGVKGPLVSRTKKIGLTYLGVKIHILWGVVCAKIMYNT